MGTTHIHISICPTNMEIGDDGDILDEDNLFDAIREVVKRCWPDAVFDLLQVGYRQGDEWFHVNGQPSDDLRELIQTGIDYADESLYQECKNSD